MQFSHTQNDMNVVRKMVSENGKWVLGFQLRTFGRLQLAFYPADSCGPTKVYCCGDDRQKQLELYMMVKTILESFPEDTPEREIAKVFPEWKIRPVYDDPEVWGKICQLFNAVVESKNPSLP